MNNMVLIEVVQQITRGF